MLRPLSFRSVLRPPPSPCLRCALCEPNFYKDSETYLCTECQGTGFQMSSLTTAPFVTLYILAGLFIVVLIGGWTLRSKLDYNKDGKVDMQDFIDFGIAKQPATTKFLLRFIESSMLRILLTFFQIASPMASNLGVKFPPRLATALDSFSFLTFSILPSLNLSCFTLWFTSDYDAIDGLFITALWPLAASFVILVVIPLTKTVFSGDSYLTVARRFVSPFLLLTFFVYISTCTEIFRFFKCDEFEDISKKYLEVDYSVSCDDDRYEKTRVFVFLMILLWPVGVPAMYAALLFRQRHILVNPPPRRKVCFAKNTSGDYLLLRSDVLVGKKRSLSGIKVTLDGRTVRWLNWDKSSGNYKAGYETGIVAQGDREKVALWLADPWAHNPKYMHPDAVKIAHLSFIAASYRPEYWFFEVLEERDHSNVHSRTRI